MAAGAGHQRVLDPERAFRRRAARPDDPDVRRLALAVLVAVALACRPGCGTPRAEAPGSAPPAAPARAVR